MSEMYLRQTGFTSGVCGPSTKSTGTESVTPINSNSCYENQQLANGLHKSITRKFKKHKVYAFF